MIERQAGGVDGHAARCHLPELRLCDGIRARYDQANAGLIAIDTPKSAIAFQHRCSPKTVSEPV